MTGPAVVLNHFQAMLVFAFVVSVAFAFLTKRGLRERAMYVLWAFLAFLLVAIGLGWVMYPFSR
jgi:cytochrome bd-type quinol oxidase subunit 2